MRAIYFIFILFFLSCRKKIDIEYIESKVWAYESGLKIGQGDFIEFDIESKLFYIHGDTIFYKQIPKAKIVSLNKSSYKLILQSLESREKGIYINREAFTR